MRIWTGPPPITEAARAPGSLDSVNVGGGYALGPSVDGRDRDVLYFSGKRCSAPSISRSSSPLHRFARTRSRPPALDCADALELVGLPIECSC